jgi:flagellar motor switch protein FliN/FliY
MSHINPEVISRLNAIQPQIWQNVGLATSETVGTQVTFADPITMATGVNTVFSEFTSAKLTISFAFAEAPDHHMMVIVEQDTLRAIYEFVTGRERDSIDESCLSELRPFAEAIVQGMCLAAGNMRNEAVVASALTIRIQVPSLPSSMQTQLELVRTNVAIGLDGASGSVVWLADEAVIRKILNMETLAAEHHGASGNGHPQLIGIEESGLDLLLDIPMEVTVELGRVKMLVKDVVELGSGSIIEIDKAAGEPVDVMVNNRLVARGEVVVIDDNFGVRITEILSPADRMAKLNEVA